MSFFAGCEGEVTRQASARLAWTCAIAAGIAGVFAFISFMPGLPIDVRWYAPLASAWINFTVVANGLRVSAQGATARRRERNRNWHLLGRALWRALRRQRGMQALWVVVRAIPWLPWGACACACASAAATVAAWLPLPPATLIQAMASPAPQTADCAFLLVLAFVTLIAERHYQAQSLHDPSAGSLVRMLRVVLLTTLAAALAAAWMGYARTAPDWLPRAVAAFNAAIAVELAARALLVWFLPPSSRAAASHAPASAIAGIVRWRPSPLAALSTALRLRYGIDLRQNWVLQSVVRLLPATLAAIVTGAWLLTAVVMLGPGQRAVYERFGKPVDVWQPGPHVGLPWPFGKARIVENGTVHRLVVSGDAADADDAGDADDGGMSTPAVHADDATPEQMNRLWDVAHPWETTQVIAGASGEQQNFQIVNADVRLDYRIGADDAAARAALYRTDDLASTVRTVANREVVRYLASHTLESLLETRQTAMADAVRNAVQTQLDRLGAGVDVVAVVIESIHPPAGAALAYHGVQAAQVRAQASVAEAQAYAAGTLGEASRQALQSVAGAGGQAAEAVARARAQQIDFDADISAARLGGPAFLLEYYLHNLQQGLRNAHLTVIDDRLAEGNRATLDLRAYPLGDLTGIRR